MLQFAAQANHVLRIVAPAAFHGEIGVRAERLADRFPARHDATAPRGRITEEADGGYYRRSRASKRRSEAIAANVLRMLA
jgi:hypothetical protein